tara:strand:+ start:2437 stop:2538 length:102 start_codon:yes stop_codon:yes gene_type:complete
LFKQAHEKQEHAVALLVMLIFTLKKTVLGHCRR